MTNDDAPRYVQVTTTLENRDDAERLAREVLEARLAACAQIQGPIASRYRWKGAIETADEWLCTFKTAARALPLLVHALEARHPYETPEIIALPILGGGAAYLRWIDAEVVEP